MAKRVAQWALWMLFAACIAYAYEWRVTHLQGTFDEDY
jgi:hypothetical protein